MCQLRKNGMKIGRYRVCRLMRLARITVPKQRLYIRKHPHNLFCIIRPYLWEWNPHACSRCRLIKRRKGNTKHWYTRETPVTGTPIIISQYAGDVVERLTQVPVMNEPEPEKIRTFTNIMDFLRLQSKIITG